RGFGDRTAALARDQHMNIAADLLCGGQRLQRRIKQHLVVVLGKKKCRHQIAPASFSLPTSSATDATFAPALRPLGSVVVTTSRRGATSTPSASGAFSSIGFFLAFMMFGRLA